MLKVHNAKKLRVGERWVALSHTIPTDDILCIPAKLDYSPNILVLSWLPTFAYTVYFFPADPALGSF